MDYLNVQSNMTIYLLTQGQGNILIRRCVSEYQHIMCYSISLHNYFVPIVQISPASCKLDLNICKTITELLSIVT